MDASAKAIAENGNSEMLSQDVETFEVIIVGGGPAGSSAAATCAGLGISVCIVDKENFPREKLCGGLFTGRSRMAMQEIFSCDINDDLFLRSDKVDFLSGRKKIGSNYGDTDFYFTMRYNFDNFLMNKAIERGSRVLSGEKIVNIDVNAVEITTETGRRVSGKLLIGADGVNSLVARTLFGRPFKPETIGFGLEVEVPRNMLSKPDDSVEIDFSAANWGYGWVFPKQKTYTVGVGGIHRINENLRTKLEKFLRSRHLDISDFKVKGQFIPFGDFKKRPGRGKVVLVGDAAGLVDPITGEGIAYAMLSGHYAALAAQRAIETGDFDNLFEEYRKSYVELSSEIKKACFWRKLIFPSALHPLFKWAFADAGTLRRGYLEMIAGKHGYDAIPRIFLYQVLKAITKPIRVLFKQT